MEKPPKQARLSFNHPNSNGEPTSSPERKSEEGGVVGGGFSEEELCDLLREESARDSVNNTRSRGVFLSWLSAYLSSPAVYHLTTPTVRQLHGWLVLQLGGCSCAFSRDQEEDENHAATDTIRLLLQCLSQIYLTHPVSVLLNPHELKETLKAHMRQTIRIVRDRSANNSSNRQAQDGLTDHCLRSINVLFDAQVERFGEIVADCFVPDEEEFKDFLLAVLEIFRTNNGDGTHSISFPAYQLLLKLTSTTTPRAPDANTLCYWARIAQRVTEDMDRPHQYALFLQELLHREQYRSQSEWLFHVECYTSFASFSFPDGYHGHDQAVQTDLMGMALDESGSLLSARAARCLSQVAIKRRRRFALATSAATSLANCLKEKIFQIFCQAHHRIKIHVLPGLRQCCSSEGVVVGAGDVESITVLKTIVSNLVDLILNTPEHHGDLLDQGPSWRRDAAHFLHELLLAQQSDVMSMHASPAIPVHDVISICLVFLDSFQSEAVTCAVETLHQLQQRHPLVLSLSSSPPTMPPPSNLGGGGGGEREIRITDLMASLVTPLVSNGNDVTTKEKACDLYVQLTLRHPLHLSYLVRTPRALEGLVRSASIATLSATNMSSLRLRQASISLLLAMTRDPCHHRILAKQAGLLSLLIRYVRQQEEHSVAVVAAPVHSNGQTQQGENHHHPPSMPMTTLAREEIKANILHIAAAL